MNETKCEKPGIFKRRYPGRDPDYVCDDHAQDTVTMLMATGFISSPVEAVSREILELDLDGERPCACTAGRVQVVHVG